MCAWRDWVKKKNEGRKWCSRSAGKPLLQSCTRSVQAAALWLMVKYLAFTSSCVLESSSIASASLDAAFEERNKREKKTKHWPELLKDPECRMSAGRRPQITPSWSATVCRMQLEVAMEDEAHNNFLSSGAFMKLLLLLFYSMEESNILVWNWCRTYGGDCPKEDESLKRAEILFSLF